MNILIIGTGTREHALTWKLAKNTEVKLFAYGPTINPGISELVEQGAVGEVTDVNGIVEFAREMKVDIAWVGPEAPLAAGVVDGLQAAGVFAIGPTQQLAQIESSKSFTRDLQAKHGVPGAVQYQTFTSMQGVRQFMEQLDGQVVVKPDGLTGGKGVQVMDDHFASIDEALEYCEEIVAAGADRFVIEEKVVGQEFSLISLTDGVSMVHMPVVQDHKRAYVNDEGPNTGGMGSYSMPNHQLPFVTEEDVAAAQAINEATLAAIKAEHDTEYVGVLYGGFMAVQDGVKLIEYNARFGDPECMNLMMLLETDLVEISAAIKEQQLSKLDVQFSQQASVCKYMVPEGYPNTPVKDQPIDVSAVDSEKVQLFYGSVDQTEQGLIEKGSRTVAVVAKADTVAEAEQQVESEIQKIEGPLFHREDIGTADLINRRITMMQQVRS